MLKGPRPVGLDIGSRTIAAAQLGRDGSPSRHLIIDRLRPGKVFDADEAHRLAEALDRAGFDRSRIALGAPPEIVKTEMLELPPATSGAPIEQIARAELARMHGIDRFEMAFWVVPPPARAASVTHAVAVACPHDKCEEALAPFDEADLTVASLEPPSIALARTALPHTAEGSILAILDIGWSRAELTALHGDTIIFERTLAASGIGSLTDTLARTLRIDDEHATVLLEVVGLEADHDAFDPDAVEETRNLVRSHLARTLDEVRASLGYAAHRYPDAPVSAIRVIGGGAALPGVACHLETELGIATRTLTPAQLTGCGYAGWENPALTTAFALAGGRAA